MDRENTPSARVHPPRASSNVTPTDSLSRTLPKGILAVPEPFLRSLPISDYIPSRVRGPESTDPESSTPPPDAELPSLGIPRVKLPPSTHSPPFPSLNFQLVLPLKNPDPGTLGLNTQSRLNFAKHPHYYPSACHPFYVVTRTLQIAFSLQFPPPTHDTAPSHKIAVPPTHPSLEPRPGTCLLTPPCLSMGTNGQAPSYYAPSKFD
ncbi:hypothetical protein NMY22_g12037 [Coprinellus aureogranulatus]|nr:hypothetical protein NMY22_g12037 [Coprinellus aureogranulatus]